MRTLFAFFVIMLSLVATPAHVSEFAHLSDSTERLQKADLSGLERLRFLTSLDFPPLNYLDADGRLSGFNVDLARALCDALEIGNRCQIQALPWEELQSNLKNGQGEAIIAGLSADRDTRMSLGFTRPYLRPTARFVTLKNVRLDTSTALEGQSIGVIANSAHEKMLKSYFPKAMIASFGSREVMYADLQNTKVAAVFGDGMSLSFWLSGSASKNCCDFSGEAYFSNRFLGNGMRIAVKAEDAPLEQSLNYALKAVKEKGVLDELYLKYFPVGFY